ncbi:MAG: type II toxin-antitoxin system VapC family toxin [Gammaproteobacteria bacterium]
MILIDANLLIYAVNADAPAHRKARRWLESTLSGTEEVGIPWLVVLAFLRVSTRRGILERPLSTEHALAYVDGWLEQPFVSLVGPGPSHWAIFRNLVGASGAFGNLTSDAHIAALALELGATVCSADYDFRRFPGIRHVNPLE